MDKDKAKSAHAERSELKLKKKEEKLQKKAAKKRQKREKKYVAPVDRPEKQGRMKGDRLWLAEAKRKAKKINGLEKKYSAMSQEDMQKEIVSIRKAVAEGKKLDQYMDPVYAMVREAARRTVGMRPYDVQVIGAIALHEGKIAELKTGEGKTLLAVLPACLHALEGKGVHVVTVNDYLAERDAGIMRPIYEYIGLTVGTVLSTTSGAEKKEAYACDVTYVTNTELGFDYLRDNMAQTASATVLRGLHYAIIDEVDSILIDEARTPLIISGDGEDVEAIYRQCDALAKTMERGSASKEFNRIDAFLDDAPVETGDFIVHEKDKIVILTASGVSKVEKAFGLSSYSDPRNIALQHTMNVALKANYIMKRDKDYIVRNGLVAIVDEFTGRVMEGRQYADGLHQAIEAKEGLEVEKDSQTIASTTYQSFFNKYDSICGMTGTAYTEKKEFRSTYGLKVAVVPTNRPMIRKDYPDRVYMSKKGKLAAVIEDVRKSHDKGQPVLLGTASVKTSETVSRLLDEAGIPHQVLNAKQDKQEAEIISHAGEYGAVTVATNMAGRGTDIILDDRARKAGGLKVIGTERHESRRIDNQLRGRSGRQGDPGESVFYLSFEDDMMRLYGGDRTKAILKNGGYEDSERITSRFLLKSIRKAQLKVEENNYGARKNVLDYDTVNDSQRSRIYEERQKLLAGDTVTAQVEQCISLAVDSIIEDCFSEKKPDWNRLSDRYEMITDRKISPSALENAKSRKAVRRLLHGDAGVAVAEKEFISDDKKHSFERSCLFSAIDTAWMEQLRALEFLQQGIFYLGYAQIDAKSMYAVEAYDLYERMKKSIYLITAHLYFRHSDIYEKTIETGTGSDSEKLKLRYRKDGADAQ